MGQLRAIVGALVGLAESYYNSGSTSGALEGLSDHYSLVVGLALAESTSVLIDVTEKYGLALFW